MKSCDKYQDLISRLVDGEVNRDEYADLMEHMRHCSYCSATYAVFHDLSEILQSEESETLPEGLHEHIMAGVRRSAVEKKNRRLRGAWMRTALTAAACAALVLFAVKGLNMADRTEEGVIRSDEQLRQSVESEAAERTVPTPYETAMPSAAQAPCDTTAPSATPTPAAGALPARTPDTPVFTDAPAATPRPVVTPDPYASVEEAAPTERPRPTVTAPPATPMPTASAPTPTASAPTPTASTPAPTPVASTPTPAPKATESPAPTPATPAAAETPAEPKPTETPTTALRAAAPPTTAAETRENEEITQAPSKTEDSAQTQEAKSDETETVELPELMPEEPAPKTKFLLGGLRTLLKTPTPVEELLEEDGEKPDGEPNAAAVPTPSDAAGLTPAPSPSGKPKDEKLRLSGEKKEKLKELLGGEEKMLPEGEADMALTATLVPEDPYAGEEELSIRVYGDAVYYVSSRGEKTEKSFLAACSADELKVFLKELKSGETPETPSPSPTATADPYLPERPE